MSYESLNRENFTNEEVENKEEKENTEFYEEISPRAEMFANTWQYSFKINPEAETFSFNHEKKEISISPKLVEKLNLDNIEKKFVFFHELGHLIQFMKEPESYLKTFEIIKEKGEEADSPEQKKQLESVWHSFFNVFLDINANSLVIDKNPNFRKGGEDTESPKNLYNRLFNEEGLSEQSLSWQFLVGVLKPYMTKDKEISVSDEVNQILEQEINLFGNKYNSVHEFIEQTIGNPHIKPSTLLFYLKEVFMPIFEKLLKKDVENNDLEPEEEIKKEFNKWDEDMDMDPEKLEEALEDYKEANKSADQSEKERQAQEYKEELKENGLGEQEAKRILEIQERTREISKDLTSLWKNFIRISTEYRTEKKSGFKTGSTIVPENLAQQLPILLNNPSEATIFSRQSREIEKQEFRPQKISLELLVDLSGSMNEEKKQAVQEVVYSLGKSLISFYRDTKISFGKNNNPFKIDINVTGFGDTAQSIFEKEPEEQEQRQSLDTQKTDLDDKLTKTVADIKKTSLGGTQDALALKMAKENSEEKENQKELKEDKNVMIVLEITDGETATIEESKKIIEQMNKQENVYVRAIQIPGPIFSEKEEKDNSKKPQEVLEGTDTFKEVWQEQGKKLKELSVLKETVVAILYDALKKD